MALLFFQELLHLNEEGEDELKGTILEIISDTSFTLETEDNGTCIINTDESTNFKDFTGVSDLMDGDEVEVEGTLTEDCVLLATVKKEKTN